MIASPIAALRMSPTLALDPWHAQSFRAFDDTLPIDWPTLGLLCLLMYTALLLLVCCVSLWFRSGSLFDFELPGSFLFTPSNMSKKRKHPSEEKYHTYTVELKQYFPDLNIALLPFAEGGGGKIYRIYHDAGHEMPMVAKISNPGSKDAMWREMRHLMNTNNIGPYLFRMFVIRRSGNRERTVQIQSAWDMDLQAYFRTYRRALPDHIVAKVKAELRRLHSLSYVHGDIKTTNILVNISKSGFVSDITLSDFDFTREHGEEIDEYCDAEEYWSYLDSLLKSTGNKQLLDTALDEKMLDFAINNIQ